VTRRMPVSTRGRGFSPGLGPGGAGTLYRLGLISAGKALALVVLAQSVAIGIVSVIGGTTDWRGALFWGILAAAGRGLLAWATRVASAHASLGAKEKLRAGLAERLLDRGSVPVGSSTVLATHGLDDLDEYYGTVLPAVMNAAVIPLVIGARILAADWVSAVVIVLTVPLIPVFMALVGMHTRDRVADSARALARLSDHLVELARGLPVLVGLGRVEEQSLALEEISEDYRVRTMVTLRTAFLSALVLELLSTISVAVVAVFIGLRLVDGSLPLAVGLLALILAPECYAPFRELGSAFHASSNGLAALRSTRAILEEPRALSIVSGGSGNISLASVTIRFPGHPTPAVVGLTALIERRETISLIGASGSGKSSVLAVLAGRLADGTDGASVTGTVEGVDASRVAWLPQRPVTVAGTVIEELRLYGEGIPRELLATRIAQLAERLGIVKLLGDDPAQLSPGELRRVAFVRALLRVDAGAELLLLDEPTAHLDDRSAGAVRREIAQLRGAVTMVVASHDAAVTALTSRRIAIGPNSTGIRSPAVVDEHSASSPSARPAADVHIPARNVPVISSSTSTALRMLGHFLAAARARFIAATLLGTAASLFAVSLTAVSGWLIVRASEHPAIMYLLVAIVGVRFFGIGRAVLRYAEQLASHDAIFRSSGALRLRLWRTIASRGAATRALLRGGTTVDFLVVTTDRIRDLVPRVVIPAIVGALVSIAALAAVALLHSPAVPLLVCALLLCLVVAPAIALAVDRHAGVQRAALGSQVARLFAALAGAAGDLRANGVDGAVRRDLAELDLEAGARARRGARALGVGQSIVVFVSCATAVLMLPVCLPAVTAGTLPGEIVAVLVLLPLALLDPLLGAMAAVQQWPTLAAALAAVDLDTVAPGAMAPPAGAAPESLDSVHDIELAALSATWPGAATPAFRALTATAGRGDWLVVDGPSGSGKSTLLTVLLGYLAPAEGSYRLDGRDSRRVRVADIRRRTAWSPQEGVLFDSSIRANLLLARSRDDAPTDAELDAVLRRVGLGPLLDSLPDGLDAAVGSEGSRLSGGERQRVSVARALLTRADILLLDEPTAHLDEQSSAALMADLRNATSHQITVLVTHRATDLAPGDLLVALGEPLVALGETAAAALP
jgi:ATP-binding cassette subfamily C protein CydCD